MCFVVMFFCSRLWESSNSEVCKFTTNGHFLTAVGTKGNGPLQFDNPRYIAYNASNNKLYRGRWGGGGGPGGPDPPFLSKVFG